MKLSLPRRRALTFTPLALALLAGPLLGCAPAAPTAQPTDNPPAATATEPAEIAPDEATPAGTLPAAGEGSPSQEQPLTFVNQTGIDICSIYIDVSGAPRLLDRLEQDQVLADGESMTLAEVAAAPYDIRVDDCDGKLLVRAIGVYLGIAPFTWTLGELSSFTFVNESEVEVCALHVSPVFATNWGPPLNGDDRIEPGETFVSARLPGGGYDVLALPCGIEVPEEGFEDFQVDVSGDYVYTFTGESGE